MALSVVRAISGGRHASLSDRVASARCSGYRVTTVETPVTNATRRVVSGTTGLTGMRVPRTLTGKRRSVPRRSAHSQDRDTSSSASSGTTPAGIATDLLYHPLAPMTIGLSASFPERVTASGGIYVQHDDREVPDTYMTQLDYPDDYTIVLTSSMANEQDLPTVIRGHRATIYADGRVVAEEKFANWFKRQYGAEEIRLPSRQRMGHMDNFLHCVRTREKPHCDAEIAYGAMVGIRLGVDSHRQDKVMFFDAGTERQVSSHPRPDRTSKFPVRKS